MKLQPLGPYIVVKLDGREELSKVIHVPKQFRPKRDTGTVLAVGTGNKVVSKTGKWNGYRTGINLDIGDRVALDPAMGVRIQVGETDVHLIHARNVYFAL
jgi:co-chaperonin GroES (HSP10)